MAAKLLEVLETRPDGRLVCRVLLSAPDTADEEMKFVLPPEVEPGKPDPITTTKITTSTALSAAIKMLGDEFVVKNAARVAAERAKYPRPEDPKLDPVATAPTFAKTLIGKSV